MVFCGSAAGAVSARVGAPYAGPGNKFWPMLHETGLTPRLIAPEEFRILPRHGIGLTDMAKFVSGSDASLPRSADDPDAVTEKMLRVRPAILAFCGKRAAQVFFRHHFGRAKVEYGERHETLDGIAIHVLPSTSGLAVRYWDPAPWHALAAAVKTV